MKFLERKKEGKIERREREREGGREEEGRKEKKKNVK